MDLNNLKDQARKIKAPETAVAGFGGSIGSLDDLIERLKKEDMLDRRRMRRMMVFFVIAGIIYSLIFALTWIAPPDTDPAFHRLILGLFALIFLSIGVVSAKRARKLSGINYAEPVGSFLKHAEQRCAFVNPRDLWFMVPYLIILTITTGMSWMSGFRRYLPSVDPSVALLSFGVFWLVALAAGYVLGLFEWKKRKAQLLHEVRQLRMGLMREEPGTVDEM